MRHPCVQVFYAAFAVLFGSYSIEWRLAVGVISVFALNVISNYFAPYLSDRDDHLWSANLSALFITLYAGMWREGAYVYTVGAAAAASVARACRSSSGTSTPDW